MVSHRIKTMRNESREAKKDGAKLVKNSGRGESKGDARLDSPNGVYSWLIDYKHYENTFSVSRPNWDKLSKDAWNDNHRSPLIKVVYDNGMELAILNWSDFIQLQTDAEYDHA